MRRILVVGAGLSGATFARIAKDTGNYVKVIEKNSYVGGNCHTTVKDGVVIHEHGVHVFHTSNQDVIRFVNDHAEWKPYRYKAIANTYAGITSLPFNMASFSKVFENDNPTFRYRLKTVKMIKDWMKEHGAGTIPNPKNLKEEAINQVGEHFFKVMIKHYTEKQWGESCDNLPIGIVSRIPVRFNYDDNYFFDSFQAVPVGGYTPMIQNMLDGIDVEYSKDVDSVAIESYLEKGFTVIYTGKVDELFGYSFGELPYRSLRFTQELIEDDYGVATVNDCTLEKEYTRLITHKHLGQDANLPNWVSYEYPKKYEKGDVPYYPINNELNNALWRKYKNLVKERYKNVFLLGRLAEYKYFDMDKAMHSAMNLANRIL